MPSPPHNPRPVLVPAAAIETPTLESTPLLARSPLSLEEVSALPAADDGETDAEQSSMQCEGPPNRRPIRSDMLRDELRCLVNLAAPVIGTYSLEMFPGLVSIILVGHTRGDLTKEYLDAAALANMFMNLAAMSVGIGLTTAMDTLCSQAFGADETRRMGTYLQTGAIVLGSFFVVVCALFYRCADVLIGLGQPEDVSLLAGTFALHLLPGVPFLFAYELLRKVMQAQNVAFPMFFVAVLGNLVNVGLGYYLVYQTGWGWLGAAAARTACNVCLFLFLLPPVASSNRAETFWTGVRPKEAIAGIPEFLALGVPGMLQICFEWWSFEVLSLVCGLMPDAVVAIGSNAIILNISNLVYMPYMGLAMSCNVRVGNALGAGAHKRASLAAQLTIGMGGVASLICAALLLIFMKSIPRLFTHDEEINGLVRTLICVCAAFQIPDAINGVVQGIFLGSGRQALGAKLNFMAYYLLGIPLGCALAFGLDLGVVGLWVGMTVGLFLVAFCGTVLVSRTDWELLATQAEKRVKGAVELNK